MSPHPGPTLRRRPVAPLWRAAEPARLDSLPPVQAGHRLSPRLLLDVAVTGAVVGWLASLVF